MPISSGAAGNKNQDSYLKMYLGTLSQEKRMVLENTLEAERIGAAAGGQEEEPSEDVQEEIHTDQTGEEHCNGGRLDQSPKKSSTCTVL